MLHIFINALAASAGGGLTYVRNVIPQLASRGDVRATVLLTRRLKSELTTLPNVAFLEHNDSGGAGRVWFEQRTLPRWIKEAKADVLLSAGNFAVWRPGVPQILLSRNSLYTSHDFLGDLRRRGETRLLLDTRIKAALARWSIHTADCTVAPSEAFAQELERWTGKHVICIHHGFDPGAFVRDTSPLPNHIGQKLEASRDAVKILFVSHYNYYRNFETLIRALPLIKSKLAPRDVRLFLTCRLAAGANPGDYNPAPAAELIRNMSLSEDIVELDTVPYSLLHQLYKSADIYVSPAYAESFAHPLVEAMFSGLPVVASDLPVHQEICGTAARYFPQFSSEELAQRVCEVTLSPNLAKDMIRNGARRAQDFSWHGHVESMIGLAKGLAAKSTQPARV